MSSLIHEARGIIYFKHSFGSSRQTNDAIIDCPATPKANITNVDSHIKDLAAVLNTQYSIIPILVWKWRRYHVEMVRWSRLCIYDGPKGSYRQPAFSLPAGLTSPSKVEVLYENRTIPVSGGKFTDNFPQEYSYHIYKITP